MRLSVTVRILKFKPCGLLDWFPINNHLGNYGIVYDVTSRTAVENIVVFSICDQSIIRVY